MTKNMTIIKIEKEPVLLANLIEALFKKGYVYINGIKYEYYYVRYKDLQKQGINPLFVQSSYFVLALRILFRRHGFIAVLSRRFGNYSKLIFVKDEETLNYFKKLARVVFTREELL